MAFGHQYRRVLSRSRQSSAREALLQKFNPAEVLWHKKERTQIQQSMADARHAFFLDWVFQRTYADDLLLGHFKTKSLKGFGVDKMEQGIIAAGAILHYINTTQHRDLSHITKLTRIAQDQYVWMDQFTMRNLELFHGLAARALRSLG